MTALEFLYLRTTSLKWIAVWSLNFIPVVDSHAVVRGSAEILMCPSPGTSWWRLSWRSAAWWTFGSCSVRRASRGHIWVLNLVLCHFISCGLVCAHDSWDPGSLLRVCPGMMSAQERCLSCSHVPLPSSHSHCSVSHLELCLFKFM